MRWLKPFIFTFLSVLLLMQAGGLIQMYKAERTLWHFRTITGNIQAKAVRLTLPASEYQQKTIESGNEISVAGKMHDILSSVAHGDSVTVVAIPDAEEDEIVERISKAVHNSDKELPSHLFKLFELCYLAPDILVIEPQYTAGHTHKAGYTYTIPLAVNAEIAYPPEYC